MQSRGFCAAAARGFFVLRWNDICEVLTGSLGTTESFAHCGLGYGLRVQLSFASTVPENDAIAALLCWGGLKIKLLSLRGGRRSKRGKCIKADEATN